MSAFETLFDLIGELARRRYQIAERSFAALGLNHTEARLLTLLRQAGGEAAQDALSNQLFVDRTNAGRALQRLEQAGYISRQKHDADKRANFIRMTAKGRRTATEIARMRKQIAEQLFDGIEEHDAAAAAVLLGKALPDKPDGEAPEAGS